MNTKIFDELEKIFQSSPKIINDEDKLRKAICGTFGVTLKNVKFDTMSELVEKIDEACISEYFSELWQPRMEDYEHSGKQLVETINEMRPSAVLDVGCGYNYFKDKIKNLTGIDPYNERSDRQVRLLDFRTGQKFDVVMALGSVNFGDSHKIYSELEHIVRLTTPGGKMFFRVNPGKPHEHPISNWIRFYPWDTSFIMNVAEALGVELDEVKNDAHDRIFFVWTKPKE